MASGNKMLQHQDTVSGTTILADGTRFHWAEGRGSWTAIEHPDGVIEGVHNACKPNSWTDWIREQAKEHPRAVEALARLRAIDEEADYETDDMTSADRARWRKARKAAGLK